MDEILSLIVANGLFAVLFCALLAYEIKDSRAREKRYTQTIRSLTERLGAVESVKADTTEIKADTDDIVRDVGAIKRAVTREKPDGETRANA